MKKRLWNGKRRQWTCSADAGKGIVELMFCDDAVTAEYTLTLEDTRDLIELLTEFAEFVGRGDSYSGPYSTGSRLTYAPDPSSELLDEALAECTRMADQFDPGVVTINIRQYRNSKEITRYISDELRKRGGGASA